MESQTFLGNLLSTRRSPSERPPVYLTLQDKTWSDSTCGASGPFKPFVCELIICGRDQQIRKEPVRERRLRVWQPEGKPSPLRAEVGEKGLW